MIIIATQALVGLYDIANQRSISEEVTVGTVVSKNIINASSGMFTSTPMRYQLKIEYQYEYKGKMHDGSRNVDVDKDVYLSYNIGDTFDVGEPVPKGKEDERSEERGCKKSPQEKRLQSCKESKTAVFFCGIIKLP